MKTKNNKTLTFAKVTKANLSRASKWHKNGITDWTVADWAVAMEGEAGEACNAIKKLKRIEDGLENINDPDRQISSRAQSIAAIGEELADTFIYLNLLACRLELDLPTEIIKKFNKTSIRYGFSDRL